MERPIAVIATDGRQPHVLVIDDTQEILDLLQELLEDEGYRVTTSMALLDLDKVKTFAPDLIIEQSQEKGWTFLTLIRLDPQLAQIPLVLCTAALHVDRDEEMAEKLRGLGVRVVLKPFNIEELLAVLGEILGKPTLTRQVTHPPQP